MTQQWSGRFRKPLAPSALAYGTSIHVDWRLWSDDIRGSMAHARMLGRQGILSPDEAERLVEGLEQIAAAIRAGQIQPDPQYEDVHSQIEAELGKWVGEVAAKLHTARSRNDQVATDLRLYIKRTVPDVQHALRRLAAALLGQAEAHLQTVLPGFTHLQHAQPVTLAHHLLAHVEMLERDLGRLADALERADECPLGAGALAGTTFPIDRQWVARELGFARPSRNSMDAVADRDFAVELVAACALAQVHVSRLAEELILWNTPEFGWLSLDDAYATGSSMMPQKKNPDLAELARGRTGRVVGALTSLLTTLKGLPLTYNRDLQEDKEPLFLALDTVRESAAVLAEAVATLQFHPQRMEAAARRGFLTATDLADELVRRGLTFRQAHERVGRLVAHCEERGTELGQVDEAAWQQHLGLEVPREVVDLRTAVAARDLPGGPAPERVRQALVEARHRLGGRRD